jgi:hypothetical protein
MADEFQGNPNDLRTAAARIRDTTGGMRNRDLSPIANTGEQCGHAGVESALYQFCGNLRDGMRTMCQDADDAATSLEEAATSYTATERNNEQRLNALAPAGGAY